MALHAGEVYYDKHGVTAASINLAFRLLGRRLSSRRPSLAPPGVLAVIISSWFFEEVVRHSMADAPRIAASGSRQGDHDDRLDQPARSHGSAGQAVLEHLPAVAAVPGMQPGVALRTLPRDTAAFTGRTRELDRLVAAVGGTAPWRGVRHPRGGRDGRDRQDRVRRARRPPARCPLPGRADFPALACAHDGAAAGSIRLRRLRPCC